MAEGAPVIRTSSRSSGLSTTSSPRHPVQSQFASQQPATQPQDSLDGGLRALSVRVGVKSEGLHRPPHTTAAQPPQRPRSPVPSTLLPAKPTTCSSDQAQDRQAGKQGRNIPPVIPPWAENETQVFDNKSWTLAALFHHLKDTKLIRKSEHYALQVTERVGSSRKLIRAVSVVCLLCSACLSVNNISWAQTQHNSCAACVGRHASTSAAPPPPSSAQSSAVLVEAKQEFSLFLYTSGTPFARADNPHLKRMFQLLGMPDSPTAKQLRTSYLSSTYSRLKKRVEVVVEQLLLVSATFNTWSNYILMQGLSLMLCTDGWRHRRAGKGQPLVNCVLLKAMGGAIFHHVCQLDKGDKKDAMFYVNLHNSMADKELTIELDKELAIELYYCCPALFSRGFRRLADGSHAGKAVDLGEGPLSWPDAQERLRKTRGLPMSGSTSGGSSSSQEQLVSQARQFGFNLTVHVPPVLHGSSLEYEVWDVCDGEGWDRLMALFPSTPNDESRLLLTLSLLKVKSSAFMTRMEGWHGVWEVAALSLNSSSPHGMFTASTLRALIAAQVASFRGSRQERAGRFAAGAAAIAALWCALRHPHASVALSPTKLVGRQPSLSGGADATATAKNADTPAALAMDPGTPAREDQLLHSFLQLGGMRSLVVSLRDLRALLTDQEACRQLAASARRDHASNPRRSRLQALERPGSGKSSDRVQVAERAGWFTARESEERRSRATGAGGVLAASPGRGAGMAEAGGETGSTPGSQAVAGQLLGVTPEEVWSALLHAAALPAWLLAPLPPHDLLPMAWDRALRVIQQNFKMHLAKKSWSKLRKVLQHQRQLLQGTSSQKGAQDPEEARQRDLEAGRRASDMLSASTPSDPSVLLALGLEKYWEHSGSRHAGVAAAELLMATLQNGPALVEHFVSFAELPPLLKLLDPSLPLRSQHLGLCLISQFFLHPYQAGWDAWQPAPPQLLPRRSTPTSFEAPARAGTPRRGADVHDLLRCLQWLVGLEGQESTARRTPQALHVHNIRPHEIFPDCNPALLGPNVRQGCELALHAAACCWGAAHLLAWEARSHVQLAVAALASQPQQSRQQQGGPGRRGSSSSAYVPGLLSAFQDPAAAAAHAGGEGGSSSGMGRGRWGVGKVEEGRGASSQVRAQAQALQLLTSRTEDPGRLWSSVELLLRLAHESVRSCCWGPVAMTLSVALVVAAAEPCLVPTLLELGLVGNSKPRMTQPGGGGASARRTSLSPPKGKQDPSEAPLHGLLKLWVSKAVPGLAESSAAVVAFIALADLSHGPLAAGLAKPYQAALQVVTSAPVSAVLGARGSTEAGSAAVLREGVARQAQLRTSWTMRLLEGGAWALLDDCLACLPQSEDMQQLFEVWTMSCSSRSSLPRSSSAFISPERRESGVFSLKSEVGAAVQGMAVQGVAVQGVAGSPLDTALSQALPPPPLDLAPLTQLLLAGRYASLADAVKVLPGLLASSRDSEALLFAAHAVWYLAGVPSLREPLGLAGAVEALVAGMRRWYDLTAGEQRSQRRTAEWSMAALVRLLEAAPPVEGRAAPGAEHSNLQRFAACWKPSTVHEVAQDMRKTFGCVTPALTPCTPKPLPLPLPLFLRACLYTPLLPHCRLINVTASPLSKALDSDTSSAVDPLALMVQIVDMRTRQGILFAHVKLPALLMLRLVAEVPEYRGRLVRSGAGAQLAAVSRDPSYDTRTQAAAAALWLYVIETQEGLDPCWWGCLLPEEAGEQGPAPGSQPLVQLHLRAQARMQVQLLKSGNSDQQFVGARHAAALLCRGDLAKQMLVEEAGLPALLLVAGNALTQLRVLAAVCNALLNLSSYIPVMVAMASSSLHLLLHTQSRHSGLLGYATTAYNAGKTATEAQGLPLVEVVYCCGGALWNLSRHPDNRMAMQQLELQV
ncbi:hypothetical protein QJQ45_016246 [Haematococcus lacustris]|nr:hypothetical protein QJQ45_016246 [Haematococcus lacustris]